MIFQEIVEVFKPYEKKVDIDGCIMKSIDLFNWDKKPCASWLYHVIFTQYDMDYKKIIFMPCFMKQ